MRDLRDTTGGTEFTEKRECRFVDDDLQSVTGGHRKL